MTNAINQEKFIPTQDIQDNAEDFIQSMTPLRLKNFNTLIEHQLKYRTNFIGQELMAKKAGCWRETANRHVKYFYERGMIKKTNRPYNSNVYEISPYFFRLDIIQKLKNFLPALKTAWLLVLSQMVVLNVELNAITLCILGYKDLNRFNNKNSSSLVGRKWKFGSEVEILLARSRRLMNLGEFVKPDDILSEQLKRAMEMGFSLREVVELSCFTERSIEEMLNCMKYAKNVRDRLKWAYSMCQRFNDPVCHDNVFRLKDTLSEMLSAPKVKKESTATAIPAPIMKVNKLPERGMSKNPDISKTLSYIKKVESEQHDPEVEYEKWNVSARTRKKIWCQ